MSPRKIVVFGATGKQGSSVARSLVADKNYTVLGITRNPDSAAANAVAALGVTMVKGDLGDPASYIPALKDAYGVFLVTDYWSLFDGTNEAAAQRIETKMAKNAVDAAAAAEVKHLVFSTADSFRPRMSLPHFDGKANVTGYIRTKELPATQLYTCSYYSNVHGTFEGLSIQKQADGSYVLHNPLPDDVPIASFAVEQMGLWVKTAFDNPDKWIGADMQAAVENLSAADMAEQLAAVSGKKVVTVGHKREGFLAHPHYGNAVWLSWLATVNGEFKRDIHASHKVVPEAWTFTEWAKQSKLIRDTLEF